MSAYGAGRAIRITSSNGWDGLPIRFWRSAFGHGAGSPFSRPFVCIGFWPTFREFRPSNSIWLPRGVTPTVPISRRPVRFFRYRRDRNRNDRMGLIDSAARLGESLPWPDPVLRGAIEILVSRTDRRLAALP